jgi:hypothetical protein
VHELALMSTCEYSVQSHSSTGASTMIAGWSMPCCLLWLQCSCVVNLALLIGRGSFSLAIATESTKKQTKQAHQLRMRSQDIIGPRTFDLFLPVLLKSCVSTMLFIPSCMTRLKVHAKLVRVQCLFQVDTDHSFFSFLLVLEYMPLSHTLRRISRYDHLAMS